LLCWPLVRLDYSRQALAIWFFRSLNEEVSMTAENINQAYPRLETVRLVLRALRMEDADFILKERADSVIAYYMRDEDPLKTREQANEMLRPMQTPEKMPSWLPDRRLWIFQVGQAPPPRRDRVRPVAGLLGARTDARSSKSIDKFRFPRNGFESRRSDHSYGEPALPTCFGQARVSKEGLLRDFYCRDGIYNDQVQFSLLRSEWQHSNPPEDVIETNPKRT